MNYKGYVFFDLDGTLLNEHSELSNENRDALIHLKKNGYLPVIASGRAPFEIESLMKDVDINTYISLNGQIVIHENEVIYADSYKVNNIEDFLDFSMKNQHTVAYYSKDTYKINAINTSAQLLYAYDHAPLPEIDTDFYKQTAIYFLYLFSQDEALDKEYIDKFDNIFTFYRDSPYSLAVVKKPNSKQAGIQLLLHTLNGTSSPTYAFGDGMNDMPMLESVDTAIVMGNAEDSVKTAADYITGSNTEKGIIDALKHFNLL